MQRQSYMNTVLIYTPSAVEAAALSSANTCLLDQFTIWKGCMVVERLGCIPDAVSCDFCSNGRQTKTSYNFRANFDHISCRFNDGSRNVSLFKSSQNRSGRMQILNFRTSTLQECQTSWRCFIYFPSNMIVSFWSWCWLEDTPEFNMFLCCNCFWTVRKQTLRSRASPLIDSQKDVRN